MSKTDERLGVVEKRKRKKKWLFWLLGMLLLLVLAFLLYTVDYYRAGEGARRALESDTVLVMETDYGWFFDGPSAEAALIFYPGAKVEETACAPLLHRLAAEGLDVCLVKMPLHLAFFGMNAADEIRASYDYAAWYIGGHSLGGAVAAIYASSHDLDGVILFAAYPTRELDEPMLIFSGSEDGVVNRERLAQAEQYGTAELREIAGGNHAGFGDYGCQRGDGEARISPEEQQETAAEAVLAWLTGENAA